MDKRNMSNEEVFKLEANEIADQMGGNKPFDEEGNAVVKEKIKKKGKGKKDEVKEED